jgi:hypothetical protein
MDEGGFGVVAYPGGTWVCSSQRSLPHFASQGEMEMAGREP